MMMTMLADALLVDGSVTRERFAELMCSSAASSRFSFILLSGSLRFDARGATTFCFSTQCNTTVEQLSLWITAAVSAILQYIQNLLKHNTLITYALFQYFHILDRTHIIYHTIIFSSGATMMFRVIPKSGSSSKLMFCCNLHLSPSTMQQ